MKWPALKRGFNNRWMWIFTILCSAVGVASVSMLVARETVPVVTVKVVNIYPHDSSAFTQGLCFDSQGNFYEGTGLYGSSELRQVDLNTGKVLKSSKLPRDVFGEGISIWNDRLVQLTWKKQRGVVYELGSFRQLGMFRYRGEGWGLTHDGKQFIKSNGSARIQFLKPSDFSVVRTITVTDGSRQIKGLNELEYLNGEIWANIWYEDYIVCIDPQTGKVKRWLDLRQVWPEKFRGREQVLNGIAQNPQTGQIFVTGKNWPKLYEIQLNE